MNLRLALQLVKVFGGLIIGCTGIYLLLDEEGKAPVVGGVVGLVGAGLAGSGIKEFYDDGKQSAVANIDIESLLSDEQPQPSGAVGASGVALPIEQPTYTPPAYTNRPPRPSVIVEPPTIPKPSTTPMTPPKPTAQPVVEIEPQSPYDLPALFQQQGASPYLLETLCPGLLFCIGPPGSGKTSAAIAIVKYRIYHLGHQVWYINTHKEYGTFQGIQTWGVGASDDDCFSDAARGLQAFLNEKERRYQQIRNLPRNEWDFLEDPITLVVEELGSFKGNVDEKLMQTFTKSAIADLRKANLFVIGISQFDTMEGLGGASGVKDALFKTMVVLKLQNKPDPSAIGGYSPLLKGHVLVNANVHPISVPPCLNGSSDFSDIFPPEVIDEHCKSLAQEFSSIVEELNITVPSIEEEEEQEENE